MLFLNFLAHTSNFDLNFLRTKFTKDFIKVENQDVSSPTFGNAPSSNSIILTYGQRNHYKTQHVLDGVVKIHAIQENVRVENEKVWITLHRQSLQLRKIAVITSFTTAVLGLAGFAPLIPMIVTACVCAAVAPLAHKRAREAAYQKNEWKNIALTYQEYRLKCDPAKGGFKTAIKNQWKGKVVSENEMKYLWQATLVDFKNKFEKIDSLASIKEQADLVRAFFADNQHHPLNQDVISHVFGETDGLTGGLNIPRNDIEILAQQFQIYEQQFCDISSGDIFLTLDMKKIHELTILDSKRNVFFNCFKTIYQEMLDTAADESEKQEYEQLFCIATPALTSFFNEISEGIKAKEKQAKESLKSPDDTSLIQFVEAIKKLLESFNINAPRVDIKTFPKISGAIDRSPWVPEIKLDDIFATTMVDTGFQESWGFMLGLVKQKLEEEDKFMFSEE